MRIVIAPNSFRSGPDAGQVAASLALGARAAAPTAQVEELPLADGGDGTLEVLLAAFDGRRYEARVCGPAGEPCTASYGLSADGRIGLIEMAAASGLRLVNPSRYDPAHSSSYGTGELIRLCLDRGVERLILGVGGTATLDAGAGALAALGAVFRDAASCPLEPTPHELAHLEAVDLSNLDRRLAGVRLEVLADVWTPPSRHLEFYGIQKGLAAEDHLRVKHALSRISERAAERGLPVWDVPWMGAGGCLSGGFAAFLGAEVHGGAERLAALAGLPERLAGADLVLTAEGRLDRSTGQGKLVAVVSALASRQGVPAVIIAGQVAPQSLLPEGAVAAFSAWSGPSTLEEAIQRSQELLANAGEQVVRLFGCARIGKGGYV